MTITRLSQKYSLTDILALLDAKPCGYQVPAEGGERPAAEAKFEDYAHAAINAVRDLAWPQGAKVRVMRSQMIRNLSTQYRPLMSMVVFAEFPDGFICDVHLLFACEGPCEPLSREARAAAAAAMRSLSEELDPPSYAAALGRAGCARPRPASPKRETRYVVVLRQGDSESPASLRAFAETILAAVFGAPADVGALWGAIQREFTHVASLYDPPAPVPAPSPVPMPAPSPVPMPSPLIRSVTETAEDFALLVKQDMAWPDSEVELHMSEAEVGLLVDDPWPAFWCRWAHF